MVQESNLQKDIMGLAEEKGVLATKIESKSMRGWPDLLLMFEGRVVFIEVKHPSGSGRLSPAQQRCHLKIKKAGGDVYTVNEMVVADTIIRKLINGDNQ